MKFKGPERRTYYDMNPWYLKNHENGLNDWHQHVVEADQKLLNEVKKAITKVKPESVLEVGCGGGDFTLSYASSDFKHYAFEYSSVAIQMAKKKENPHSILFREADALSIDSYLDKPYDLIISKDVLHCILGIDRLTFLKNIKDSLSTNGLVMLTTHVGIPENKDVKKFIDLETRENHLKTRVYLDEVQVDQEMLNAGFIIDKKICSSESLVLYFLK